MISSSRIKYWQNKKSEIFRYVKLAMKEKSLINQIIDIIKHKIMINTSPIDYYRFAFYNGEKTWEEKSRYVGKRGSRYFPYENNYIKYLVLFNNKLIFKTILEGFELPQPKLLSVIGNSYELNEEGQLAIFLSRIKTNIAIKPIYGSGGQNILILHYKNDELSSVGKKYSVDEIWKHVSSNLNKGFIVEEKIENRSDISQIYPFSLNTYRIISIKTTNNVWHNLGCFFKIGRGKKQVDNLGAGSIHLCLDQTGKTVYAYDWTEKRPITHHPDTGKPLIGIQLEGYEDVYRLALKASKKFSFMGTIGWDIAFTDRGPLIIEGNAFYDCSYWQTGPRGGLITDEVAKNLKKRNMFSRWDKKRVYPHFWKKHT